MSTDTIDTDLEGIIDLSKAIPMRVPLDQIEEPDLLLRQAMTKRPDFKEMLESIRVHGVGKSILLRRTYEDEEGNKIDGPPRYIICDGMQRYTCSCMTGKPDIPALVLDGVDEGDALEMQIQLNKHQVRTGAKQFAQGIKQIFDRHPERTLKQQAKRLRVSDSWLKDQLNIAAIPDSHPATTLLNDGKIVLSNGYTLAKLFKVAAMEPVDLGVCDKWVQRAQNEAPDRFFADCTAYAKELLGVKKGLVQEATGPAPKMRRGTDIKAEVARARSAKQKAPDNLYVQGYSAALDWIVQQDPASTEAWVKEREEEKAAAAAKAAEKEAKKTTVPATA